MTLIASEREAVNARVLSCSVGVGIAGFFFLRSKSSNAVKIAAESQVIRICGTINSHGDGFCFGGRGTLRGL